jgi:DNA-binding GntR family transcriptional regulator
VNRVQSRSVTQPRTKAERVYGQLRADILAGRHQPGARLRYTELCDRYDTSMGVLRESMLRLAEQGLVKGEPQQGFQVVTLSPADLRELTDARSELESLTLRHAIAEGDVEWESRLIAAHHLLSRTPQLDADDPERLSDQWVAAHAEFHRALLDGCSNHRLKDIAGSLRDAAELYRRWSVPLGHAPDRDIAFEHAAILESVLARDSDQAIERLIGHIEFTTNVLLDTLAGDRAARVDEDKEPDLSARRGTAHGSTRRVGAVLKERSR